MTSKSNSPEVKVTKGAKVKFTPAQRDKLIAAVRQASEASGNARFLQAVATGVLMETPGAIGADGIYRTQSDYARAIGTSNGNVSGLKTLAVAIRCGMTVEDPAWGTLSSRAADKAVSAVATGPRPSAAKFRAAAKAAQAKHDAQAKQAKVKQSGKGKPEKPATSKGLAGIDRVTVGNLGLVTDLLSVAVIEHLPNVSGETLLHVEEVLATTLDAVRAELAKVTNKSGERVAS